MSKASTETVTCPACQHKQEFVLWHSINVTLDPGLKAKLRSGDLTTFRCGRCGNTAEVVSSLLYHDMQQHWMIWVVPDGRLPEGVEAEQLSAHLPGYRLRRVRTRNDLVEKLNVFDAGLDDRLIAVVKVVLRNQLERESGIENAVLFFDEWVHSSAERGPLRFAWVNDDKVRGLEVPWELYENAKAQLEALLLGAAEPPDAWLLTDDHYACRLLAQRK